MHFANSTVITGLLILSACGHVQVKDAQVCTDIGSQGATCDNFLTSNPIDIPLSIWEDKRFGMFCISSDSFADFKREIEELCSATGKCDYETKAQMKSFFARMDRLRSNK